MKSVNKMRAALAALIFSFSLSLLSPAYSQSPISGFNPATLVNGADGLFIDGKSFWGSNALPLQAIFRDKGWEGPFRPADRNNIDVFGRADTGIIYRGWRLAGFYREELFIEANRDTVEVFRMINMRQDLPVGRIFDINLKARGFSATGIELSRGFRIEDIIFGNALSIGFTARYMSGSRIQEGTIKGNVIPTDPKIYDFTLKLDYVYDENFVYERRNVIPGRGAGYSFDIGIKYEFNDSLGVELLFRDILGRIYRRDVPYTTAELISITRYFDEYGYMVFRPTIRGYRGNKDFTQKIPLKTDITLTYTKDSFWISPTINFIENRPLYWINIGYKPTENLSFDIGYNINYRSLSMGIAYKEALFEIHTDNVNLEEAMAIGFSMSLRYEW